jgi:hypothetical protein
LPAVMAPTMMSISVELALLTASSTAPTVTTGLAGKLFPKMLMSPPLAGSWLGATESMLKLAVVVVVGPVVVVVVVAAVVVVDWAVVVVVAAVVVVVWAVVVVVGAAVVVVVAAVVVVAPVVVVVGWVVVVVGAVVVVPVGTVVEVLVVGATVVVVVAGSEVDDPPPTPGSGEVPTVVVGTPVVVVGATEVVVDEPAPAAVVVGDAPDPEEVVEVTAGVGDGCPTLKNTAWELPIGVDWAAVVAA